MRLGASVNVIGLPQLSTVTGKPEATAPPEITVSNAARIDFFTHTPDSLLPQMIDLADMNSGDRVSRMEPHLSTLSRIATCAKTAEPKAKLSLPDKPPHHTGIDWVNRSGQIKQCLVICISIKL